MTVTDFLVDQLSLDTQSSTVGQDTIPLLDLASPDAHGSSVQQDKTPGTACRSPYTQSTCAVPEQAPAHRNESVTMPNTSSIDRPVRGPVGPILLDPTLTLAAEVLDDIEQTANANANRLRQLTRTEEDADGRLRGAGLTLDHPQVATLAVMVETLKKLEKDAVKNLEKAMRAHPLGPWVKSQAGVGDKQAARLLAAIGDPYWRSDLLDENGYVRVPAGPRTVSALWAYCGKHVDDSGVGARRKKGQRANWSVSAGSRAYVIAESCIKQTGAVMSNGVIRARSPYRDVYDDRRSHTDVTHPEWSDGHRHNDAMRVAAKAFLRELWVESRRLHTVAADRQLNGGVG